MQASPEQRRELLELVHYKMPFGKYKGRYLVDLPEFYLIWFRQKGFPEGKLGRYLALALEIKLNSLEEIIAPLRKLPPPSNQP